MEVAKKTAAVTAEPLKLQDKLTDDWVQPFACNHVIVNVAADDRTGKKDGVKQHTTASYCVLCGEFVVDNGANGQSSPVDTFREKQGKEFGPDSPQLSDRRMFGSFRRSSSVACNVAPSSGKACTIHGHKMVKYFCEDHQEICCSVCVNVLHRGCQRIMSIKDEIQAGWNEQICKDTIIALQSVSRSFQHVSDQCAKLKNRLYSEAEEFRKRRDELRAHIVHLLDQFVKSSEKKLRKFIAVSEQEFDSTSETCRIAVEEAESSIDTLEQSLKTNSIKETFIATQKVLQQRTKYGTALFNAISGSKEVFIELIPETKINSLDSLEKIGHVQFVAENVHFAEQVISAVSKLPTSNFRSPRTARDARSESSSSLKDPVSLTGKFNVRLPEDKNPCENVGATFLQDGRVAIVDLKNRKLKVFDSKFSQACAVTLSSEPRDVSEVSPQEVAVSLPDESKIQFISTGKTLQITRSVLTSMPCYGITCHNQDLVVICDDGFSTTAIQTMDFDGKVIKTIKTNRSGKVLLKNPWNISMSFDGHQICVTDKGRLVNFDKRGYILFQYTHENLQNPRGLAADETGKFYVCGTGSDNVHQVSPDGKLIDIILSEESIRSPQAVCYQPVKKILLVTCVGNDTVFLYKLAK